MDVVYFDLWENEEQEKLGYVFKDARERLFGFQKKGRRLIALGLHVFDALAVCGELRVTYLPHPASRRPADLQRLREGLESLKDERLVLIGGYPLGRPGPFDISTRSGKVLRRMVSAAGRGRTVGRRPLPLKKDTRLAEWKRRI